jgi:hypothetical protein
MREAGRPVMTKTILTKNAGFVGLCREIVLVIAADASPVTRRVAEVLAGYCSSTDPHPFAHL